MQGFPVFHALAPLFFILTLSSSTATLPRAERQISMIFPDDNPQSEGLNSTNQPLDCAQDEVVYDGKCEKLLIQGSCPSGQYVVEDEGKIGQGACVQLKCNFPHTLSMGGECISSREYICPQGMRLTLSRGGEAECDCRPKYLYHSGDGVCYEAFQQGSCRRTHYFVLPPSNTPGGKGMIQFEEEQRSKPKCIRNPCRRQGFVCLGTKCSPRDCVRLGSPCEDEGRKKGVVQVKEYTLEVGCVSGGEVEIEIRVLAQIPPLTCSPGTKRDLTGKCRRTVRFNPNG